VSELVVPDARFDPVPVGWAETVAFPVLDKCDWGALDDGEAELDLKASIIEALGGDAVEFEKALRYVGVRRGRLAGVDVTPGARTDLNTHVKVSNASAMTVTRWRMLARHWEWLWPEHVRDAKTRQAISQARLLKYIDERTPARGEAPDFDGKRVQLLHGDFRDRLTELEPGSVDLILTDPPYPNEFLPLWSDLSAIANKLLSPKGYLLAMSGKIHLDQVMGMLGEHLRYKWVFNWPLEGAASRILSRNIRQTWKPILCYTVGTFAKREPMPDTIPTGAAEKDVMAAWQQQVAPAQWLIERMTPPEGLVVDPFLGAGSFGLAAINAGRRFVGVELDAQRFEQAKERML
jgi:site-specific DNA-methyltransferase (adenine-specific)